MNAWLLGAAVGGCTCAAVFAWALWDCSRRAVKCIAFERKNADKWRDMAYDLARENDKLRAKEERYLPKTLLGVPVRASLRSLEGALPEDLEKP